MGGNVQPLKLLRSRPPAYPERAREAGIEGVVLIRAVILTDGTPSSLVLLNSPDQDLGQAALEAVRQWRYQPVLLNGAPIEAIATITVNFRLDGTGA